MQDIQNKRRDSVRNEKTPKDPDGMVEIELGDSLKKNQVETREN